MTISDPRQMELPFAEDSALVRAERDFPVLAFICLTSSLIVLWLSLALMIYSAFVVLEINPGSALPLYDSGSVMASQDSLAQGAGDEKPDTSSSGDAR